MPQTLEMGTENMFTHWDYDDVAKAVLKDLVGKVELREQWK